ncbi:hypothetical protein VN97_g3414 [Penicillium thymicola]|uniref:Uncharacterized protein n=1 Tax=Penicillium thymicola TaxID=293382 RepID=A0AAI9TME9_PENTH|nr:hypothetical protein VN97_g3414 [Penicillium thymicola]
MNRKIHSTFWVQPLTYCCGGLRPNICASGINPPNCSLSSSFSSSIAINSLPPHFLALQLSRSLNTYLFIQHTTSTLLSQ